ADEGIPVAVHSTIYRVNKVYEEYGSRLGDYTMYSPKYTKEKVLIFPTPKRASGRGSLPAGPVFSIEETIATNAPVDAFRDIDARFFLSSTCDGRELREVIAAVAPKEVYFFGPYAKRFSEELKS